MRKKCFKPYPPEPIIKFLPHEEVSFSEDGESETVVLFKEVDVTADDFLSDEPTSNLYTLKHLIESNIPLNQVNCEQLLTPTDFANWQQNGEIAVNEAYQELLKEKGE